MEIFLLKQRENVRERERERGREREWNIVRNRRRGRLRMEPIERTDPRLSYEGNRHGQQPKYHHANWRDGTDITSFYFTRFLEDARGGAVDHFQKIGGRKGDIHIQTEEQRRQEVWVCKIQRCV